VSRPSPPRRTRSILALPRLFRVDAAFISFLSYIVGVLLEQDFLRVPDFMMAAFITLISTNFIYSYNCVRDYREDTISHPNRPIPSGDLDIQTARRYTMLLLFLSISLPFLLANSAGSLILMEMMPLLGLVYSAPPLHLRRYPAAGILIISAGLVIPLTLGALQTNSQSAIWPTTLALFFFCLSTVPLKALEEVEEDLMTKRRNLFELYGRKLLAISGAGILVTSILSQNLVSGIMHDFILAISLSTAAILLLFARRKDPSGLYRMIIRIVILEGFILALLSWWRR